MTFKNKTSLQTYNDLSNNRQDGVKLLLTDICSCLIRSCLDRY